MPGSVQELERQVGVRLVVADRTDPEEIGYIQWRTAFYVAGRMRFFFYPTFEIDLLASRMCVYKFPHREAT